MQTISEPTLPLRNFRSHLANFTSHISNLRFNFPFPYPKSKRRRPESHPHPAIRPYLADGPIINQRDRDQLYSAVSLSSDAPAHLRALMQYLASATPIPPPHVPPNLVTMNSIVVLRALTQPDHQPQPPAASPPAADAKTPAADTASHVPVELVYPWDAETKPLARSITAPLGATLLGKRVGQTITWPIPRGHAHATIDGLEYQPEREGHYDR